MKCKIFRATFVSHWKVSLSNVLSSSSIRTCRILNIKYLLLFSTGRRSGENQNKHSKFKFDAHQYHKKWENTYSIFFQVITQGNCDLSLILDPTTNSETLNPNCHDIFNQQKFYKFLFVYLLCIVCFVRWSLIYLLSFYHAKKHNLLKDLWKPRIHSLGIGCWIQLLITSDMPFELIVLVKLTGALITSKSPYLLMHRLNMLFEIRWDWRLVSAQMTNFKITFLSMNVLLMLSYPVFYGMSVIAFITFPWFTFWMLVSNVLFHIFESLENEFKMKLNSWNLLVTFY